MRRHRVLKLPSRSRSHRTVGEWEHETWRCRAVQRPHHTGPSDQAKNLEVIPMADRQTSKNTSLTQVYLGRKKACLGASLVAQWLRVRLLMRGTRVRAPVREDPTCHGAAGPMSHGRWACASGACAARRRERPAYCKKQKQKTVQFHLCEVIE